MSCGVIPEPPVMIELGVFSEISGTSNTLQRLEFDWSEYPVLFARRY